MQLEEREDCLDDKSGQLGSSFPMEKKRILIEIEKLPEIPYAMTEITTTEQLKAYLVKRGSTEFDLDSAQLLAGGSANFVWRLLDKSGKRIIIKHAEPYVKTSPGLSFPVDRMDFEHNALTSLPMLLTSYSLISLPEVYDYDFGNHVLTMEDGGDRTLKDVYADGSTQYHDLCSWLGWWLADMHQRTEKMAIGDNQTAKSIYRFAYSNLAGALRKYDQDPSLAERIDAQYGSLLETDDECVCHGDFWPGNVLFTEPNQLKVVDWEMVRRGCGATDVGQFAAEVYLLEHFRGCRGLRKGFLGRYGSSRDLDDRFMRRVAIHMGVHLAFWPTRVSWGTEKETKEIVEVGCKLMRQALDDDDDEDWSAESLVSDLRMGQRVRLEKR